MTKRTYNRCAARNRYNQQCQIPIQRGLFCEDHWGNQAQGRPFDESFGFTSEYAPPGAVPVLLKPEKPTPTPEQEHHFLQYCAGPTLELLEDMRYKQKIRAYKGPWTGLDIFWAYERLAEEVAELHEELFHKDGSRRTEIDYAAVRFEAADVGNFSVIANKIAREHLTASIGPAAYNDSDDGRPDGRTSDTKGYS